MEMRGVRRVILTHWNAGVFRSEMLPNLLPELVVYALLCDEVLIREEDLLTNRRITTLLSQPEYFSVFEELLDSGIVKLLRLPLSAYPSGRRFDPERLPISARAEEHEQRRSYKGKPWRPTVAEWRLFRRLDEIVVRSSNASRFHAQFSSDNLFAEQLAEILENRNSYRLGGHPVFCHLNSGTADAFVRFCREPDAWQSFVHDSGLQSPIVGPDEGFYRSAAYQCSMFLPTPRAIRRLVESVYAATYCEREASEGRYGGSDLVELPLRFQSDEEYDTARNTAVRAEVVPTSGSISIGIAPRISAVLQRTRASSAFENLQRTLEMLGSMPEAGLPTEVAFRHAWCDMAAVYAENWTRVMVQPSVPLRTMTKCVAYGYVLGRVCGLIVLPEGPLARLAKGLQSRLNTMRPRSWLAFAASEKRRPFARL